MYATVIVSLLKVQVQQTWIDVVVFLWRKQKLGTKLYRWWKWRRRKMGKDVQLHTRNNRTRQSRNRARQHRSYCSSYKTRVLLMVTVVPIEELVVVRIGLEATIFPVEELVVA